MPSSNLSVSKTLNSLDHSRMFFRKFSFVFLAALAAVTSATVSCDSPRNNRVLMGELGSVNEPENLVFKSQNLNVEIFWSEGPYPEVFKTSKIIVFIYDDQGTLVDLPEGLNLSFFTLMPSMGHSADDTGYFTQISTGVYENPSIVFQMPGDWQMEIRLVDADFSEKDKVSWLEFF